MKKSLIILIILILLMLLNVVILKADQKETLLKKITEKEIKIDFEIKIDPKIELVTTLLNYSYWDLYEKFKTKEFKYYNNLKKHFDKYKDHTTIKWFDKASRNWNLGDPVYAVLWYDKIPLKQKVPFPLIATSQINTTMVKVFIEKLNQFAKDTAFNKFWKENKVIYNNMINKIIDALPYRNYIKKFEDFYGEKKDKYTFILAPLFNGLSLGPLVKNKEFITAYFISGFDSMKNGTPYFKIDYLKMLIFHEFGHSFVNPVCEEYRIELYKYENMSKYLKHPFLSNYAGWFAFCHEHIVRAGENILFEKAGFKKAAERNYKKNLRLGFILEKS